VLAAIAALPILAGCSDGDAACGPVLRERLDPGSGVHLLPGAEQPDYLSDPPTSGPHLSGRAPTGVHTDALDRPTQVLVLESGGVLVQHRDLPAPEVEALEALAGDRVVVAPNPDLPAPIVATAWLVKQTCREVDLGRLRRFADDHGGTTGHEGRSPAAPAVAPVS
jgi:hypothetical protein